ncbi:MAG: glycosyltransferase, partial [Oscillospiraceae bacterium]|nr:glycosyltransferase [Oscillospiraceae bacterium]
MRVLQVFGRLDCGGAETMLMNLYRNTDREKVQFDFVMHTTDECYYSEEIRNLGGKIYSVPRFNVLNIFSYIKAWKDFFKEHNEYKLIHAHMYSTASIYLRTAKKNGIKTIAHSHSTSNGKGMDAIIKNLFQLPIRYIADNLFACSLGAGEWLYGKKACRQDNFYILNNAIDTKRFVYDENIRNKLRRELDIENKFAIICVGRFSEVKNHKFLVKIFKETVSRHENSVLLLA